MIDWVYEQVEDWDDIDMDDVEDDLKLVLCRANPEHQDIALVNRLISRYIPFDFLSRFEFNRPNFHRDRENWPESYSEFVAYALENTYIKDKDKLYGELYL